MHDSERLVLPERRAKLGLTDIMTRVGLVSFGLFIVFTFEHWIIKAVGWLIAIGCIAVTVYELLIFQRGRGEPVELTPEAISLGASSLPAAEIEDVVCKKEAKGWDGNTIHDLHIKGKNGAPTLRITLNLYLSGPEQADAVFDYVEAMARGEEADGLRQRLTSLSAMLQTENSA